MERSNILMLEGFSVRHYPDWEKVSYVKFDVGFFSSGKLNGYGKEYMLEPIFQNNKCVGGYERITLGYYKDDLLNGIGLKIEDDEIIAQDKYITEAEAQELINEALSDYAEPVPDDFIRSLFDEEVVDG